MNNKVLCKSIPLFVSVPMSSLCCSSTIIKVQTWSFTLFCVPFYFDPLRNSIILSNNYEQITGNENSCFRYDKADYT